MLLALVTMERTRFFPSKSCEADEAPYNLIRQSAMLRNMSCMSDMIVPLLQAHEHADELYRACPRWCISWQQRGPGIMAEILHWAPDIGCLQEVDHPDEFRDFLQEHG